MRRRVVLERANKRTHRRRRRAAQRHRFRQDLRPPGNDLVGLKRQRLQVWRWRRRITVACRSGRFPCIRRTDCHRRRTVTALGLPVKVGRRSHPANHGSRSLALRRRRRVFLEALRPRRQTAPRRQRHCSRRRLSFHVHWSRFSASVEIVTAADATVPESIPTALAGFGSLSWHHNKFRRDTYIRDKRFPPFGRDVRLLFLCRRRRRTHR